MRLTRCAHVDCPWNADAVYRPVLSFEPASDGPTVLVVLATSVCERCAEAVRVTDLIDDTLVKVIRAHPRGRTFDPSTGAVTLNWARVEDFR